MKLLFSKILIAASIACSTVEAKALVSEPQKQPDGMADATPRKQPKTVVDATPRNKPDDEVNAAPSDQTDDLSNLVNDKTIADGVVPVDTPVNATDTFDSTRDTSIAAKVADKCE